MKIIIISDIHDRIENLKNVFEYIKNNSIKRGICLGDFIAPPVVKEIINTGIEWDCCWGNNDGEKVKITKLAMGSKNYRISDSTHDSLEINERKVFITHYPDIAIPVSRSGMFDAVFYGHDHEKKIEKLANGTLLLNPGEVAGSKTGNSSFAVWETDSNFAEIIEL